MNSTLSIDLPPLPSYTLHVLPPLIPGISDHVLQLLMPVIAYWALSIFFQFIDYYDIWPQYRLHTPVELMKRNRVTKWEVIKDVVLQQILQTLFGIAIGWWDPVDTFGKEEYDIARWGQRIRLLQKQIPNILRVLGLDAAALGATISKTHPIAAGPLLGGHYPGLVQNVSSSTGAVLSVPAFAAWELATARAIYYLVIPALQFGAAVIWVDTWQYMLHRAMHMNKFLYTWLHARHHRLYVPYAFGALYNHPIEGFLLDILGTGLAYLVIGMSTRQGLLLFTIATLKTVDDHCGYALPWDPFQHISSNNAAYHDIHHQSWGIKSNFSQPFFIVWDRMLGTQWKGGDVTARYQRAKLSAQQQYEADVAANAPDSLEAVAVPAHDDPAQNSAEAFDYGNHVTSNGTTQTLADRVREEKEFEVEMRQRVARSIRKRNGSVSGDGLKSLRDKVSGGTRLHGGRSTILHAEGSH